MKLRSVVLTAAAALVSVSVYGQQPKATPTLVIVRNTIPPPQVIKSATPAPIVVGNVRPSATPLVPGAPGVSTQASNLSYKGLSFSQIKSKIAEAKRQMQTRPLTTASVEPVVFVSLVRVAYYDLDRKDIDYVIIAKDQFLTTGSETPVISTRGQQMMLRVIRANGVNTPITIFDDKGRAHLPLLIQYPVEKDGRFIETAYYMSTHPGIVTPDVVSAGRFYVQNTIDIAREKLRERGIFIQPKVTDIAERLATVEHVDHYRFRTEFHPNIYNDIFTLYALNEGQTYRYSVSSAGAGGMVQMIPSTYRMVRSRYPQIDLMPDFVEGMRDHVNASQAMLLYMQMTWNDLIGSPTVFAAMQSGIATQEQLMAAGYNSNPAKLPGYINRGGAGWTNLIPRETKIYLQIYSSLESSVRLIPRTTEDRLEKK